MKKRKWLLVGLFCLLLVSIPHQVMADDASATLQEVNAQNAEKAVKDPNNVTQPKEVKKAGVSLHIERFPLSRYQANNEAAESKIKGAFLGLANVFASLSQKVVNIVDTGMDVLYNLKPIDTFATKLTQVSTDMYQVFKANFGQLFFMLGIGFIAYLFFIKLNAKEAIKRFFMMLLVIGIGGWWMVNAGYMMQTMNALSIEAQGKLMGVGNTIVHTFGGSGNYEDTSKIQSGKEVEGTVAIMRNVYFDMALQKPFLIANFGSTDASKINRVAKEAKGLNRIDTLLSFKLTSEGEKAKLDYIKQNEIREYDNEEMADGNVYTQFGINFVGFIGAIALGIPFLMLAFFSFLLQLLALGIAFILPIMFFVAWLPWMANSGYVGLKRLISVFVIKALLGLLVVSVYLMCFIVDLMIPPSGFGLYALNLIVTAGLLILIYNKRDKAISFVTAGKVKSVDSKMVERVRQEVVQPSWEAAKKTGHVAGATVNTAIVKPSRWIASKVSKIKEPSSSTEEPESPENVEPERTPQVNTPINEEPTTLEARTPQQDGKRTVSKTNTKKTTQRKRESRQSIAKSERIVEAESVSSSTRQKSIPSQNTASSKSTVSGSREKAQIVSPRTPQQKMPERMSEPPSKVHHIRTKQGSTRQEKVLDVHKSYENKDTGHSVFEQRDIKSTGTDIERMHKETEKRDAT
ncbi:CD3337/EF1877 family mobilome membrane protein [Listeria booriae]|uniref:CD3337/EF1877 family mobilome membrane protein n=1 Tax=Listeria booriae TaxID=1552123 RepID=UPI001627A088|nr:hypothetical protein [Listeria booriae]MBC2256973.1 hypothetical protein [Listeria booriae]